MASFPRRFTMAENSNATTVEPSETLTTDEVLVSTDAVTKRKPTKTPSKGETLGKIIEACLLDWGIERVFMITIDKASANDVVIKYVKRKLSNWVADEIILEGYKNFKNVLSMKKIECKGNVILDVCTRWNSTYLMLESALKFQKAFERLEEQDGNYVSYFLEDESGKRKMGPPRFDDWETSRVFVKFLKKFYDATLKFSASLSVRSNLYFHEVFSIQSELTELSTNTDPF
ncbi:hypothetical protein EZV62_010825 [Acer yangbiense]|uniref:hAT-like transposase RNase-H fold domain-containing protein n=1 Tax=Acer yangbiense TaxID=1000413 RepID=A0A5C7I3K8_9ROSI|nr:hypothetical protein EZV62_010825 [Acer yangbiense]